MAYPIPPIDFVKVCKLCGEEFHPNTYRQQFCGKEKSATCPICGKEFTYICSSSGTRVACSKPCTDLFIQRKREASAAKLIKVCKFCGKEFTPKSVRDVYCYEKHYKNCVICGKQFEVDVRKGHETQTCSTECFVKLQLSHRDLEAEHEKQKQVLMEKYGVENSAQIPGAQEKAKKTNLEKYGSEWYTQTEQYRSQVAQTSQEKYGVDHYLQSREIIDKRISTLKETKGVENVFQLSEVKEKSKKTNLEKYGVEYASQAECVKDKVAENNIRKYGVKHPMMLKEYQQKAIDTCIKLYGRRAYTQQHISNITSWYEFISDPRKYVESHYSSKPRAIDVAKDLGVDASTVDVHLQRADAIDCLGRVKSVMELEIVQYIEEVDPMVRIIHNDKTQIRPLELDLYLPDYNFAIECDPTCTHNSSFVDPWGGDPKSISYHKQKTDACEEKGIFLLHIFGYDWAYSKDIILSMISNVLKKNVATVYARNCEIREVPSTVARKFLNENHRQGSTNSLIRLGLYLEDTLVSLMTFGKMRATIGTGGEDLSDCYELVRFCSLKYTTIVGGASKLFKYFLKHYNPVRVRSFSDRAHTRGALYAKLGFIEIRRSEPGYVWVDVKTDRGYHRYSAQKQNLTKFLKDDNLDLSKTEKQIMEEHEFAQVYDSGTITWEYTLQ